MDFLSQYWWVIVIVIVLFAGLKTINQGTVGVVTVLVNIKGYCFRACV